MDLHKLQVSITADIKDFKKKMQDVKKEAENVSKQAKIDAGLLRPTKEYEQLNVEIKKCQKALDGLLTKQKTMPESKTRQMTTAYASLQQQIDKTANDLAKLEADLADMASKGYKENDPVFAGINQEALKLASNLEDLLVKKEQMEDSGKAYSETKAYQALNEQIKKTTDTINDLNKAKAGMEESGKAFETVPEKVTKTTKSLKKSLNIGDRVGKSFKRLGRNVLRMGMMFLIGGRALYGIVNSIKFGFNNLVQVSSGANKTVSNLKSSVTQVKNAFATAFLPILQAIEPLLTRILGMLTNMLDKVAQFFTALSGGTSYKKAVNYYEDYADSISNANDKLLAFDKINKLSNTTSADNYFQTEKINSNIKNLADTVKKKFEEILSKLKELKQPIEDFKNALKSLKDSEGFQWLLGIIGDIAKKLSNNAFNTFKTWLEDVSININVLREAIDTLFALFNGDLESARKTSRNFFQDLKSHLLKIQEIFEKLSSIPLVGKFFGLAGDIAGATALAIDQGQKVSNNMVTEQAIKSGLSSTQANGTASTNRLATVRNLNTSGSTWKKVTSDNVTTNVNVTLEGDASELFRVVRKEANIYQNKTGNLAFGG